jgi:hypothetical protein
MLAEHAGQVALTKPRSPGLDALDALHYPFTSLRRASSVAYRPQSSGASRGIGTTSILSLRSSSSII